jgi:CTP:phosphocholine cytidylyltransferase-like protein
MRNKNFITGTQKGNQKIKIDDFFTIIILGENHGYRMKSYGPLPLIKIHNKTLIERQINAIKDTFINFEIILCTGYDSVKTINFIREKFSNINIRAVENQIHYNSNCCESARLCLNNTKNDNIIILGGGVLLLPSQLPRLNFSHSTVITQDQPDDSNFEVGVIQNNGNFEQFSLGIKQEYWTEIIYLNGFPTVNKFSNIISNMEYKNRFLFEAINELSKSTQIKVQKNTAKPIVKINNIKALKRMVKI